jgi:hypothetical protein
MAKMADENLGFLAGSKIAREYVKWLQSQPKTANDRARYRAQELGHKKAAPTDSD